MLVVVLVLVVSMLTLVSGETLSASVWVWAIAVPLSSSAMVKAAAFMVLTPLLGRIAGGRGAGVAPGPQVQIGNGPGRAFLRRRAA